MILCFCGENIREADKSAVREACYGEPVFEDVKGNCYCVLHFPSENKVKSFSEFLGKKLQEELKLIKSYEAEVAQFKQNPGQSSLSESARKSDINLSGIWVPNEFIFGDVLRSLNLVEDILKQQINFTSATFNKPASFDNLNFQNRVIFSLANFVEVSFVGTIFGHTDNVSAKQPGSFNSSFIGTVFNSRTNFENATFKGDANFTRAVFGENSQVLFIGSVFKKQLILENASIKGSMRFKQGTKEDLFSQNESELNLQYAHIENPERVSFDSVYLRTRWFINVDSHKLGFSGTTWEKRPEAKKYLKETLKDLKETDPSKILVLVLLNSWISMYRQLASNAEQNARYENASHFRRMAMDVEWLKKKEKFLKWLSDLPVEANKFKNRISGSTDPAYDAKPPVDSFGIIRRSGDILLHILYKITSFYGESWGLASSFLILIILVFAFVYTFMNFQVCPREKPLATSFAEDREKACKEENICNCRIRKLYLSEALSQSVITATLQSVEYRKPTTTRGEMTMTLEKILAPLQFALLALAIRRKFMQI